MWGRRKAKPAPSDTLDQDVKSTLAEVARSAEDLRRAYERIHEPLSTLEQRYPYDRRKPE